MVLHRTIGQEIKSPRPNRFNTGDQLWGIYTVLLRLLFDNLGFFLKRICSNKGSIYTYRPEGFFFTKGFRSENAWFKHTILHLCLNFKRLLWNFMLSIIVFLNTCSLITATVFAYMHINWVTSARAMKVCLHTPL